MKIRTETKVVFSWLAILTTVLLYLLASTMEYNQYEYLGIPKDTLNIIYGELDEYHLSVTPENIMYEYNYLLKDTTTWH